MLGTPNMGSRCADLMYPTYKSLGFEVGALRQLRPRVVAEFNSQTTNRKGVKFSTLAGMPLIDFLYEGLGLAIDEEKGTGTYPLKK